MRVYGEKRVSAAVRSWAAVVFQVITSGTAVLTSRVQFHPKFLLVLMTLT